MPYRDRTTQLTYMRGYMVHKRLVKRLGKWKAKRRMIQQLRDSNPLMKIVVPEEEAYTYIDGVITELEGLLSKPCNTVQNGAKTLQNVTPESGNP